MIDKKIIAEARRVLLTEAAAVKEQTRHLGPGFLEAVKIIVACAEAGGKLMVTGVGKSGLIARKISATFSSVGVPSVFANITELVHGDLGMISSRDTVLALSYSGDSDELKKVLPHVRGIGSAIIAMTGRRGSYLGKLSDCILTVAVAKEACPYNMVPTSSTTSMLAVGDALALAIAKVMGFKKDDFARFHPGGNLGKRLNLKVADLMRKGRGNPVIRDTASVSAALAAMTASKLGAVSVVDSRGRLIGYFTDGDLRRRLQKKNGASALSSRISAVMTASPKTAMPAQSAYDAASMMKKHNCDNLPVVDSSGRPIGIIDERDLVTSGLI